MKPKDHVINFQKWEIRTTIIQDSKEGDYAIGHCPICGEVKQSDTRDLSHQQTMELVMGHIVGHIKSEHGELLDPPIPKSRLLQEMDKIKKEIWGDKFGN